MDFTDPIIDFQTSHRGCPRSQIEDYWMACKAKNTYPYKAMDLKPWESCITQPLVFKDSEVQLSRFEMGMAMKIGPCRTSAAREAGLKNMLQDDMDREKFNEQNGVGGELAFAKLFNVFPKQQLIVLPRESKNDDGDCTLKGKVVDVKTTEYMNGVCLLGRWKPKNDFFERVHVLALMTGSLKGDKKGLYVWRGFISTPDIVAPQMYRQLRNTGRQTYYAEQKEMFESLGDWPG